MTLSRCLQYNTAAAVRIDVGESFETLTTNNNLLFYVPTINHLLIMHIISDGVEVKKYIENKCRFRTINVRRGKKTCTIV